MKSDYRLRPPAAIVVDMASDDGGRKNIIPRAKSDNMHVIVTNEKDTTISASVSYRTARKAIAESNTEEVGKSERKIIKVTNRPRHRPRHSTSFIQS